MGGKHYIPTRDPEFGPWGHNLFNYMTGKCEGTPPEWPHIPLAARTALMDHLSAWDAAYMAAIAVPTPANNAHKREVRKVTEKAFREFVNRYLRFDPVTNTDRTNMGVSNHDKIATSIGEPATAPVISALSLLSGNRVFIHFRDETEEKSEARPYGMNGCLACFIWGDEPVTDINLLKETKLMTRSPFTLELPPEAAGKVLSIMSRWQNDKGELGPHSLVHHIVIG